MSEIQDPRKFFEQYSGLQPDGFKDAGTGVCVCRPGRTRLLKKGVVTQCRLCALLRQSYPQKGSLSLRFGQGNYLFVSPERVHYWGNHRLDQHNHKIVCETATGKITALVQRLIRTPPSPPWMFVSFGAATKAQDLRVTLDESVIRFSGDTDISRVRVAEVNRRQVLPMVDAGLTRKQWDTFLDAYYRSEPEDIATMRALEAEFPVLSSFKVIPPRGSAEHVVLRWLLAPQKEAVQ